MSTGYRNKLTRQIGLHLSAAKLGRLGYLVEFNDNKVPGYDLVINDNEGHSIKSQVKVINGGSWQLLITKFLEVDIIDDYQHVGGERKLPFPNLVCIYVLLSKDDKVDFYIFKLRDLQKYISETTQSRYRSKNPKSLHGGIRPKDLEQYRDNWSLIDKALKLFD